VLRRGNHDKFCALFLLSCGLERCGWITRLADLDPQTNSSNLEPGYFHAPLSSLVFTLG
jgi:hypothetical protein